MTDPNNPYAAPRATVVEAKPGPADAGPDRLLATPRRLPAGAGLAWWREAWQLFRVAPAIQILVFIVYFLVAAVAGLVPFAGDVFMTVTFGVWGAAWVLIATKLRQGDSVTVADLFAGFAHPRAGRLFVLGLVYLAIVIIYFAVMAGVAIALLGMNVVMSLQNFDWTSALASVAVLALLFCVGLFFVIALIGYAPVLLVCHDIDVIAACRLSLATFLRNWLSMSVFGVVLIGLSILAMLPFFLGFLVLLPVLFLVPYVSYRQMFLEE